MYLQTDTARGNRNSPFLVRLCVLSSHRKKGCAQAARAQGNQGTVSFSNASTTADKNHGSYSMRILGEVDKYKYLCQTVNVSGNPDDTYIISGWARANAVENNTGDGSMC